MAAVALPHYIGDPLDAFEVDGVPRLEADVTGSDPDPFHRMVSLFDQLAGWVSGQERPVVHAADCMAPLGVVAGLQRAGIDPQLIWLDAHGDFNTWETTPSGYLGGMPVAMLVGRGDQRIIQGLGIRTLPEAVVIISDARDLDPGERAALVGSAVRIVSIEEIAAMELSDQSLHIHLDVDVVDPTELPGLLYPAPGGPARASVANALRHLAAHPNLAAISVAHTYRHGGPATVASRQAVRELVNALLGG